MVADSVADLLFIHSPEAGQPADEGRARGGIFDVGNTMIDTLVAMPPGSTRPARRPRAGLSRVAICS